MSRAFVDEDSEALLNREIIEHERKLRDWLMIQQKKLNFLESDDPKAASMDQALRMKWIRETREDIDRTRRTLDDLASSGTDGAEAGDPG
ncbi:MAG: hypothetical protein RQ767_03175 [Thermovirgaceae bacterium]|nr:hypothetical protein [Thermovirgaceae bacterium]